jgi:hypothetical protein
MESPSTPVEALPPPVPTEGHEPVPTVEPAAEVPEPAPPVAIAVAHDPAADYAADYAAQLHPGEGAAAVAGHPVSVGPPIETQRLNTFFAVGAVILLIVTVVVVILLAIFVLNLLSTR